MENKNFEYTGWKINGFVALVLILAAMAAGCILAMLSCSSTESFCSISSFM